jgi:hypothetical protein
MVPFDILLFFKWLLLFLCDNTRKIANDTEFTEYALTNGYQRMYSTVLTEDFFVAVKPYTSQPRHVATSD